MSDGEGNTNPKEIHVSLSGGQKEIDRKDKEIERLTKILSDLAEAELEEKKAELTQNFPEYTEEIKELSANDLNSFELERYKNQNQPKKKHSVGSVRLTIPNNIMREELTPEEYVDFIYEHASNPQSPYYNQTRRYKNHLKGLLKTEDFNVGKMEITSDPTEKKAIRELGENFGYEAFTEFVQRLAREKQNVK